MRKKRVILFCMCSLCLSGKGSVQAIESTVKVTNTRNIEICVQDVIVTKTRYYNGQLQYRRWNSTKGQWVDPEWIDAD